MREAFVEVLGCVAGFPIEEGQRYPLDPSRPFRINRGSGDLPLAHGRISRTQTRLQWAQGAWWAVDGVGRGYDGSTNGTGVNGSNANPPIRLKPGDVIDIAGVVLLRFGTPAARHEGLERSIADQPTDEARWRVWQDWLLENNDPLGQWMNSQERTVSERARVMGPLAKAFKGHDLSCRWNEVGFVSHLTMQFRTLGDLPNGVWLLNHLDDVPAARFITSLTLELLPIALREPVPPAVTLTEALATAKLPRSLRHLQFLGKLPSAHNPGFQAMTERPSPSQITEALAHARRTAVFLQTTERALITWEPAP